ncbi:UNVERIFIED_CONTAM: Retrovirus-related Pol polyprotein from transposon RE1 [Sesamum radiatum]|uniref:Retrovirus-related Pol polyprotein from transposon RE1 n=1 Tax=Sesamum radiatum TaxID=300843 RepID=A0AAW2VP04_SESRA
MASSSTTGTGLKNDSGDTRASALDHHGMVMISAPLNGNNWLSWSRSVRIALEGRDKLGYIDGTCVRPTDESPDLKQWKITDSMVRTWILHTLSKDIVNAYLYATSARTLWLDLEARYGECDGPLLYRVQREIGSMTQGNRTVTAYYTTLRQLWDELVCLKPPAMCKCGRCICGSNDAKKEEMEASQLIQFLTGLNESYDNIRSQILVLDPLPHVNKAYSMVLRVERQRQVNLEFTDHGENSALMGKGYDNRGSVGFKNNLRRKDLIDKRNLKCEHCHKTGHSKDTCFRLHGVPDWYKELHDQRKKTLPGNRAYAVNDNTSVNTSAVTGGGDLVADLMEALRLVQTNKQPLDPVRVHFAQGDEMAVSQLCKSQHLSFLFLNSLCLLQDQTTKHTLAIGRQVGKLYYLDKNSFVSVFASAASCNKDPTVLSTSDSLYSLWHKRLGHAGVSALSHIPMLTSITDDKHDGQKGYKVYDLDNKIAFTSRDVSFHEHVFPFLTHSYDTDSDPVVIPNPIPDSLTAHSSLPSSSEPSPHIVSEPSVPSEPRPPRQRKPPAWLKDFHCHSSIDHSCNLASTHNSFMAAFSTVPEPNHYMQAKGKLEWENAMKEELAALIKTTHGKWWIFLKENVPLAANGPPDSGIRNLLPSSSLLGFLSLTMNTVCLSSTLPLDCGVTGYVDDVLITGPSEIEIAKVKHYLDSEFTIKDLGPANYFLGLEITRCSAGTSITQHKYVRDIIQDAGLTNCKHTNTPLPVGVKLTAAHVSDFLTDPGPYRRLVGRLLYLSFTRPDISYGAQQLSQFVHKPAQSHMDAALHLVRYLKGSPDQGLFFPVSNPPDLVAFCDADWAGCIDSRRSLSGYCIFLGRALISWKSKKQPTVARSTAEAEYRSLGTTVCELKWISYLLHDLNLVPPTPIPVYCDNQAAIHIVANPVFHERTKHIELDCHLIRDHYKSGFVLPSYVPSTRQLADVFTKSLAAPMFRSFIAKLGLVSPSQVQLEGGLLSLDTSNTE